MTSSKGLVRKADTMRQAIQQLSKRGIDVRIAADLDEESLPIAKDLTNFARVKAVDKIQARFCIVDNKELMFMVMDDKDVHPTYDVGIWVNTPYFASALGNMFNLAWKNMKDATVLKTKK